MPIRDPDKRREYERNLKRKRRAEAALKGLVTPQRKPLSIRDVEPLQGSSDGTTWMDEKAQLGRELVAKGRQVLLGAKDAELTAKDALEILKEGGRIMDAVAAQTAQEHEAIPVDLESLMKNPAAMLAAQELLPYVASKNLDGEPEDDEPSAVDEVGESTAPTDASTLRRARKQERVEAVSSSTADSGRAAPRNSRRGKAADHLDATSAREK